MCNPSTLLSCQFSSMMSVSIFSVMLDPSRLPQRRNTAARLATRMGIRMASRVAKPRARLGREAKQRAVMGQGALAQSPLA